MEEPGLIGRVTHINFSMVPIEKKRKTASRNTEENSLGYKKQTAKYLVNNLKEKCGRK